MNSNAYTIRTQKRSNKLNKIKRQPPPFAPNVFVSHTYRFTNTSATASYPITVKDLIGIHGGICTVVNTTLVLKAISFRLKSVKIWAPVASSGTSVTASISYPPNNIANACNFEMSDTCGTIGEYAYVHFVPPKDTTSSFWWDFSASASTIFIISVPAGSIVDVACDFIEADTSAGAVTVATATLGTVYYLPLDHSNGTNKLIPVGLVSTS